VNKDNDTGDILIYQSDSGGLIDVRLEGDTLWLTQAQIAELFGTRRPAITKHLGNIFKNKELQKDSVCSVLEHTAKDGKRYKTQYYNLDAVISIGYRVNSREATQFRIWANRIIKEYLVCGYALNEKRLKEQDDSIKELEKTLHLIQNTLSHDIDLQEAKGLLGIITEYTQTFILLNQYDSERLPVSGLSTNITYEIKHDEAVSAIGELKKKLMEKKEASDLFANRKDDSFAGILGNIVQSFGGEYVYPTIEEQAAHLLYFVIKNHPFSDGNKRIGAFLFIWFLQRNRHHLKASGDVKINDNALIAIALLVAQSDPAHKETMICLIINLIRGQ